MQIHASCCALPGGDGLAALLLGEPGSGKSDLALRLVDAGLRLVADDRVDLVRSGTVLHAAAPEPLAGLIEVRGIGILSVPDPLPRARVGLVVSLRPEAATDRLPEPATMALGGVRLPAISVDPRSASAVARVRAALRVVAGELGSRCGALGDARIDKAETAGAGGPA